MQQPISDIAFTPSVKAAQEARGSRKHYERIEGRGSWSHLVTDELKEFLAHRDSFYLGTASAEGRPYIQHRGGPKGFLKVLDERTLAFADFAGNRQYITVGNLAENEKAFIFLMNYTNQTRIKIWGRAEVVEEDRALMERLVDTMYRGRPERAIRFHVEAWDVNCPQHITPRLTEEDLQGTIQGLRGRIAELEEEISRLRECAPAPALAERSA